MCRTMVQSTIDNTQHLEFYDQNRRENTHGVLRPETSMDIDKQIGVDITSANPVTA